MRPPHVIAIWFHYWDVNPSKICLNYIACRSSVLIVWLMMVTLFLQAMYFQNRGAFKAPYDEMSSSSKISSRWNMDGGSAAAFNPLSLFSSSANHRTVSTDSKQQLKLIRKGTSISSKTEGSQRKGIWITTDTDCKLLSLFSSPKLFFF